MFDYKNKLPQIKNENDRQLLELLLEGPRTRQELTAATQRNDRCNRYGIERLRNAGIVIVSTSRGKGYKLAETDKEVRQFVDDMQSRARKAMKTANKVRAAYGLRDQYALEAQ
jgi:hypothetical protein